MNFKKFDIKEKLTKETITDAVKGFSPTELATFPQGKLLVMALIHLLKDSSEEKAKSFVENFVDQFSNSADLHNFLKEGVALMQRDVPLVTKTIDYAKTKNTLTVDIQTALKAVAQVSRALTPTSLLGVLNTTSGTGVTSCLLEEESLEYRIGSKRVRCVFSDYKTFYEQMVVAVKPLIELLRRESIEICPWDSRLIRISAYLAFHYEPKLDTGKATLVPRPHHLPPFKFMTTLQRVCLEMNKQLEEFIKAMGLEPIPLYDQATDVSLIYAWLTHILKFKPEVDAAITNLHDSLVELRGYKTKVDVLLDDQVFIADFRQYEKDLKTAQGDLFVAELNNLANENSKFNNGSYVDDAFLMRTYETEVPPFNASRTGELRSVEKFYRVLEDDPRPPAAIYLETSGADDCVEVLRNDPELKDKKYYIGMVGSSRDLGSGVERIPLSVKDPSTGTVTNYEFSLDRLHGKEAERVVGIIRERSEAEINTEKFVEKVLKQIDIFEDIDIMIECNFIGYASILAIAIKCVDAKVKLRYCRDVDRGSRVFYLWLKKGEKVDVGDIDIARVLRERYLHYRSYVYCTEERWEAAFVGDLNLDRGLRPKLFSRPGVAKGLFATSYVTDSAKSVSGRIGKIAPAADLSRALNSFSLQDPLLGEKPRVSQEQVPGPTKDSMDLTAENLVPTPGTQVVPPATPPTVPMKDARPPTKTTGGGSKKPKIG